MRSIIRNSQLAKHCQRLRGERFVQLDHIHVGDREFRQLKHPSRGRNGAHAHNPRGDARGCRSDYPCFRRKAKALHSVLRCKKHCAGAIVDAGSIACSDRAIRSDDWLESGQTFQRGIGTRVFVLRYDGARGFARCDRNRNDLLCKIAVLECSRSALLTTIGERVLVLARNLRILRRRSRQSRAWNPRHTELSSADSRSANRWWCLPTSCFAKKRCRLSP